MKSKNKYDHKRVEAKWQEKWVKDKTYTPDINSPKKKFYNLMMFPYPSADGLHAGNMFAFSGSDIYGRFKRMQGFDVFEPIGLDGFGIHSENYAIKVGKNPKELSKISQENFYKQLHQVGNGFDWDRSLETYDPEYYKWTQWLFTQMFKAGLAYRAESEVNWCPSCKTVLADEQVMTPRQAEKLPPEFKSYDEVPEGVLVCERCGNIVVKKKLEQWFGKITTYADRLLKNLGKIDWPEKIKVAQANWIGKKEGINITYKLENSEKTIVCWTSRPETNFGATFIVVSPENPIIESITTGPQKDAVRAYIKSSLKKSREERVKEGRTKTGVPTGSYAINPLSGSKMPIWVSDFVLMEVGTGAVVGVPAHDKRDFEFATTFDIPVKRVVVGPQSAKDEIAKKADVFEGDGKVINSDFLNGLDTNTAKDKIMDHLVKKGLGEKSTTYHLRDWILSRQRYWGPPIPMIYCKHCGEKGEGQRPDMPGWWCVPDKELPVVLPEIDDYLPKGTGRGPLDDHPEFYEVKCPHCGFDAKRETDVSDTFVDSAWYFMAYPNAGTPEYKKLKPGRKFLNDKIMKAWLPVDLYFGGAEHAVLHLMYARFMTMFLFDLGLIGFEEPFPKFYAHGLVIKDGAKMSKSKGNVVNPDAYIEKFGADTLRLYLMFMGPMDGYPDFRDTGIEGMGRFINRIWKIFNDHKDLNISKDEDRYQIVVKMHQTIKKVTNDIENFRYNTAIATVMEFVNLLNDKITTYRNNDIKDSTKIWSDALVNLLKLIAPFAPFMTEEIWHDVLLNKESIHHSSWPKFDQKLTVEKQVTIAIQINGKTKSTILMSVESANNKEKVLKMAKDNEKIAKFLKNVSIIKDIYVPGRILNFVIKN